MITGPETAGCECISCKRVREVKAAICEAVEALPTYDGPEGRYTPWMAVLAVASAHATAYGVPREVIAAVVAEGAERAGFARNRLN